MGNISELVVDNFAGGGGTSTGIEMAIGRSVDIAINHDPDAFAALVRANLPEMCERRRLNDSQTIS